jgi:hypothetical protein
MGNVSYVGFATHRRATMRIHLYFKRLMIKQMTCIKKKKKKKRKKKKKKKKKGSSHSASSRAPQRVPTGNPHRLVHAPSSHAGQWI